MLQKYFIAIVPPEPLLSNIRQLKEYNFQVYKTKGALRSPGHITLHMPFSWEEEKEEILMRELSTFSFETPVSIGLKDFDFFEPRVIFINVLKNNLLEELQKKLVQHAKKQLRLFNQSDDMRGFHPHVTIAFRDLKKPVFYKAREDYSNKTFEAEFSCHSFCVLKQIGQQWEVYREFSFLL